MKNPIFTFEIKLKKYFCMKSKPDLSTDEVFTLSFKIFHKKLQISKCRLLNLLFFY